MKIGQEYWFLYLGREGVAINSKEYDEFPNGTPVDDMTQNCFLTLEEAEVAAQKVAGIIRREE